MARQLICRHCGKAYSAKSHLSRFCSTRCRRRYQDARRKKERAERRRRREDAEARGFAPDVPGAIAAAEDDVEGEVAETLLVDADPTQGRGLRQATKKPRSHRAPRLVWLRLF